MFFGSTEPDGLKPLNIFEVSEMGLETSLLESDSLEL